MGKRKSRQDGRMQKVFRINGKQYIVCGKNAQELAEKELAKRSQIAQGIEKHNNPTLNDYYLEWEDAKRRVVKPTTIYNQSKHFKACAAVIIPSVNKTFGEMKMQDITSDDVRVVQAKLLEDGRKTSSVNAAIAVLSQIFYTAIRERRLTNGYNPVRNVRQLQRTEERARDGVHRALTEAETKAFLEAAGDSFYLPIYKFALLTGMRWGEIAALKQSDIVDGNITICRTVTKQENGAYTIGDTTKTEAGKRTIPMNVTIKSVIADQMKINMILDNGIIAIDKPIFRAIERGLLSNGVINRDIKKVCKIAGIEPFSMHAFRDTFATRAIENGTDLKTVQVLLGHTHFSTTMDIYAHVMENTKQDAMDKVADNMAEIIAI